MFIQKNKNLFRRINNCSLFFYIYILYHTNILPIMDHIIKKCPKDKPILCDENTVAYGLCRKNIKDCHLREVGYPDIDQDNESDDMRNLKVCDINHMGHIFHDASCKIDLMNQPDILKIISWNIWGIGSKRKYEKEYLFLSDLMILRMKRFTEYIEEYEPHIILLQEASDQVMECIRIHMTTDKYSVYGTGNLRIITKYKPCDIYQHSFEGTKSECMFIVFENILITNLYIRGYDQMDERDIKDKPPNVHMIRCMNEVLNHILLLSDEYMPRINIICGDFGADMNSKIMSLKKFKQMNLLDCWNVLHPREPGYTENIEINQMNLNIRLYDRNSRMCGIFLKGIEKMLTIFSLVSSELVGCEGFKMTHKSFQQMIDFYGDLRNTNDDYLYFVSNHFGLYAEFILDQNYKLI